MFLLFKKHLHLFVYLDEQTGVFATYSFIKDDLLKTIIAFLPP